MKQLKMRRFSAPITPRPLPEGYTYQIGYRGSEEEITQWLDACVGIIGDNKQRSVFENDILNRTGVCAEEDLIFVLDPSGKRVATITVCQTDDGEGLVHMVGAIPESRGLGLGHCIIAKACAMLEERGKKSAMLTTNDFRLPAVKTYLDAGFLPVLWEDPESNMAERWDKVLADLNYPKVEYLPE